MLVAVSTGISVALASQQQDFAALEREAAQSLRTGNESFSNRAALIARLQAGAERSADAEQRGRLALLWLRNVRALLSPIPFDASNEERQREWGERHETVVYSEPAGQWLIVPVVVWRVHEAHRSTQSAEAIAWLAVENGYPGECEGYIPCYANVMNWLDGEYLRRHPNGPHASEIVDQVHSSLNESVKRLSESDAKRYLDPATDCGDLKSGLVPLRQAIDTSNANSRAAAVRVIDVLLERCR